MSSSSEEQDDISINTFDAKIAQEIPANFFMFAGADDAQQSADVSNVKTFELPDPAGKAGGACTAALLQVLHNDEADDLVDLSWTETLVAMREKIEEIGLPQIPQLSSSRPINVQESLRILPDTFDPSKHTARALLCGVNYVGEKGQLTGCHNDVRNMKHFLMETMGFERQNMLICMDDGKHHNPTKGLIMDSLKKLCQISKAGDVVFFQFSGHGGQVVDTSGDEEDGMDEILIPSDHKEHGALLDDDLYAEFVQQMPSGVHVICLVDCCHSGTALDLPYVCKCGDTEITKDPGFHIPASGVDLKPSKKKKEKKTKKEKKAPKTKKEEKKKSTSEKKKKKKSSDDKKSSKKSKKEPKVEDVGLGQEEDGEETVTPSVAEDSTVATNTKKKKGGLFGFGRKK